MPTDFVVAVGRAGGDCLVSAGGPLNGLRNEEKKVGKREKKKGKKKKGKEKGRKKRKKKEKKKKDKKEKKKKKKSWTQHGPRRLGLRE